MDDVLQFLMDYWEERYTTFGQKRQQAQAVISNPSPQLPHTSLLQEIASDVVYQVLMLEATNFIEVVKALKTKNGVS